MGTGFVTVNTPSARSQTIPGYRCWTRSDRTSRGAPRSRLWSASTNADSSSRRYPASPRADVSPAATALATARPAASPEPMAKLTPSSHRPAARHMPAASPAMTIPSMASFGMAR